MKFMTNEYTVTFQHEKNLEKVYWYIKRKQQSDTFMCFTSLYQLKHRNAPIIFLIVECIISLYLDFMMYICIVDGLNSFDIKQSKSERNIKQKRKVIVFM